MKSKSSSLRVSHGMHLSVFLGLARRSKSYFAPSPPEKPQNNLRHNEKQKQQEQQIESVSKLLRTNYNGATLVQLSQKTVTNETNN